VLPKAGKSRSFTLVQAPIPGVRALFFDVFGTLVDWRTSVARESENILGALGYRLDWLSFADAWRGEYQPGMEEVRSGVIPFSKLDVLHRRNLVRMAPRFGLENLSDEVLDDLTLVWHRLDAWPEVPAALRRLRAKFRLAPVSNGNISLMADLARRNDIHWDAILGSEIAGDYKPKPKVYLAACAAFDFTPEQCMMVAAHSNDLAAAAALGLRTGHVARPDEHGPGTGENGPGIPVDAAGSDLSDLAAKLGA
jgi:2-haloacid dehalogenase